MSCGRELCSWPQVGFESVHCGSHTARAPHVSSWRARAKKVTMSHLVRSCLPTSSIIGRRVGGPPVGGLSLSLLRDTARVRVLTDVSTLMAAFQLRQTTQPLGHVLFMAHGTSRYDSAACARRLHVRIHVDLCDCYCGSEGFARSPDSLRVLQPTNRVSRTEPTGK